MRLVGLLTLASCLYWCVSEVVIHDGSFDYGLILGVATSMLCAALGGAIGYLFYRALNHD